MDRHEHLVAVAGQRFVDGVVDDLEHHVVQAGAVVHVADVHAGTLADGLEAAQDGDLAGIVVVVLSFGTEAVSSVMRVSDSAGSDARLCTWPGTGLATH